MQKAVNTAYVVSCILVEDSVFRYLVIVFQAFTDLWPRIISMSNRDAYFRYLCKLSTLFSSVGFNTQCEKVQHMQDLACSGHVF